MPEVMYMYVWKRVFLNLGLVSRKERCLLSASTAFFVVRLNKIFDVEIDNNLTVDNLKDKIKDTRQDFRQVNFDLYEVNFFQPNFSIVSSVNSKPRSFYGSTKRNFQPCVSKFL
ncbi:hypothetical protein RhiirC2_521336 [Rhizophagus irregularis]|uniref:Crinkler effector protein N-terminal domain-containing protein n=1 Tax=Rhizophagus irregularis TaxID=588596 RepID=A0A2N1N4V1_9GLOM|nr:hypothetical protein RhiirC2_521336 [Rhizophagus irregularis]